MSEQTYARLVQVIVVLLVVLGFIYGDLSHAQASLSR